MQSSYRPRYQSEIDGFRSIDNSKDVREWSTIEPNSDEPKRQLSSALCSP